MIDWNKYQAEALTTAVYPLERGLDYTILGLSSEVADVAEKVLLFPWGSTGGNHGEKRAEFIRGIKTEAGDCFWYAGAVADALNVPLGGVWERIPDSVHGDSFEAVVGSMVTGAGRLAGLLKKAIRDDAGALTEERRQAMILELSKVLAALVHLCGLCGTTAHAVTQANLNKLSDRKRRGALQGSGDNR